jgi:hypothetical protein
LVPSQAVESACSITPKLTASKTEFSENNLHGRMRYNSTVNYTTNAERQQLNDLSPGAQVGQVGVPLRQAAQHFHKHLCSLL